MISTVLADDPHLARVVLWIAVGVALALGGLLHHLGARRTLTTAAALSLLAGLALTLSPDGDPRGGPFCTVQASTPFTGLDTLANSVMLLPLALFAGLATRRPWPTLAAVSALSAAIELTQALLPALGRSCDTDDWWLNTVGAVVGAVAAAVILALGRRRTAPQRAGGASHPGGHGPGRGAGAGAGPGAGTFGTGGSGADGSGTGGSGAGTTGTGGSGAGGRVEDDGLVRPRPGQD